MSRPKVSELNPEELVLHRRVARLKMQQYRTTKAGRLATKRANRKSWKQERKRIRESRLLNEVSKFVLTEDLCELILDMHYCVGMSYAKICEELGSHRGTISDVCTGKHIAFRYNGWLYQLQKDLSSRT